MKHIDEIKLELYMLNSPSITNERVEIENHLAECKGCKELFDGIAEFYTEVKQDLASSENLPMPRPAETPARRFYPLEQKYQNLSPFRRFAVGIPLRMARWMVHHPYAAGGATVMFSSFVIFALITMFNPASTKPKDMNPTNVVFAGETMFVRNAKGDTIDTELVGIKFAEDQKGEAAAGNPRLIKFVDVNNDKINEIIWGQQTWDKSNWNSIIYCKSVTENKLLWSDTLKKSLSFINQTVSESKFLCTKLLVGDFDIDGKPEVIALALHDQFPTLIRKIRADDGVVISEYLHIGGIADIVAKDINNDGRLEILACGINNAYKMACMFVLDSRIIAGHSPLTESYNVNNLDSGSEIAYLLFPKTIVGELGTTTTGWNSALSMMNFNDDQKIFRLWIDERITEGIAGYAIYLGYDLVPKNYETGDHFDLIAKRLVSEKKIPTFPDSAYWASYTKKIKYWDGEKWENQSAKNKLYQQIIANLK